MLGIHIHQGNILGFLKARGKMKALRMQPFVYKLIFKGIILAIVLGLLSCESTTEPIETQTDLESGSISFDVAWNQNSDVGSDYQIKAVVCGIESNEVATVSAYIGNTGSDFGKFGGPWECSAGSGIISGVPVGTGYTLLLYGHNDMDRTTYSGVQLDITINKGNNDIGTVTTNQFFAELSAPLDGTADIDPDSASFSWLYSSGAAEYQLWISESDDLSDHMEFETSELFFTVSDGSLDSDTTYYWTVFPIDPYGNRSWFYSAIYSFTTAGVTALDDNYEENDTQTMAYDLSSYSGVNLSDIAGYGNAVLDDYDYYGIYVGWSSATISIDCNFLHTFGDIDIELLDEFGNVIDESSSESDDEFISYDHTGGPATYYIKVYLFDDEFGDSNLYNLMWSAF